MATLEGFELIAPEKSVNEPLRETRSVYWMKVIDTRSVVELAVPGSLGNVLQDMGREPVTILIAGEFVGPDAKSSMESLMSKYNADTNKPLQFSSDMTTVIPEITKVMLDQIHFEEIAGRANSYRYFMRLLEYKEPRPQKEEEAPAPGTELENEIDDIRGQVLDSEDNPMVGVKVKVKGPDKEMEATTDEEGYYEVLDVSEGQYEITVEDDAFQDQREVIEVKKGEVKEEASES